MHKEEVASSPSRYKMKIDPAKDFPTNGEDFPTFRGLERRHNFKQKLLWNNSMLTPGQVATSVPFQSKTFLSPATAHNFDAKRSGQSRGVPRARYGESVQAGVSCATNCPANYPIVHLIVTGTSAADCTRNCFIAVCTAEQIDGRPRLLWKHGRAGT